MNSNIVPDDILDMWNERNNEFSGAHGFEGPLTNSELDEIDREREEAEDRD